MRLADLLAALSLETDLAMGHPSEEAMRTCLLATGLARRLRSSDAETADAYWTALLMHVGCTAYAQEQAALFGGDEIAVNAIGSKTDFGNPREAFSFMRELSRGMSPVQRARLLFMMVSQGERIDREIATSTCEVAAATALRLGLPDSVQQALNQLFERWDGKGAPHKLAGDAIVMPARLAHLASQAIVFERMAGTDAAAEMARRRGGAALDPHLADAFARHAEDVLREIHSGDPWRAVVDAEPEPHREISGSELDDVARAFADVVDLKSTYTLGHSTAVARLSEAAGRALGLPESETVSLRRAGYLHDLGRVGIPNGIWEKPTSLTTAEWEQVRLHPYHSERILSRASGAPGLAGRSDRPRGGRTSSPRTRPLQA